MCDHLYRSPVWLKEHNDNSGSYFGALGFTSLVEQLTLRMVPTANLLSWLTKPTGPHLNEADSTCESNTALAILVAPEALYDPTSSRVGIGLVYKAPYIWSASFSEAYFNLKCTSKVEVDMRLTNSHLMFIQVTEASKVIPHPTVRPLFLDVLKSRAIMDSNAPRSPQDFRAFRLHKVSLIEGETSTMQVAILRLQGQNRYYMIAYQKSQMIPELREHPTISVALAMADEEHWNIVNDSIYPSCLEIFRRRHKDSQDSQAEESASQTGTRRASLTLESVLPSAASSGPLSTPISDGAEVRK